MFLDRVWLRNSTESGLCQITNASLKRNLKLLMDLLLLFFNIVFNLSYVLETTKLFQWIKRNFKIVIGSSFNFMSPTLCEQFTHRSACRQRKRVSSCRLYATTDTRGFIFSCRESLFFLARQKSQKRLCGYYLWQRELQKNCDNND